MLAHLSYEIRQWLAAVAYRLAQAMDRPCKCEHCALKSRLARSGFGYKRVLWQ